jgi:signal peptidase
MKTFKKLFNLITTALLIVFILFAVLLVGVRLLGIEPYIVLSGSMEPEIRTGSLIYIDTLTPEEARALKAGDTVTFVVDKQGTKVTHKIYEVVGQGYVRDKNGNLVNGDDGQPIEMKDENGEPIIMYTTYGINNKNESTPTGYTLDGQLGIGNLASVNVIGKPAFVLPYIGYVAHFVQNPPGKFVALGICAFLIISIFFSGTSDKKTTDTPEQSEKEL